MPSKSSKWINHVLGYKKKHNVSFTEALKNASKTYKKGGDTTPDVKVEDTTPDVKVEDVKVEDVKVEDVNVKVGGNCNMLKGGKKSRKQRRSARRSRRNRKTKTRR